MVEQTSVGLAINTIEPDPKFLFRFEYNDASLEKLAESIRQLGQIHNGRVMPKADASGYFVYVGIRRYFAMKKLFDETGDPRFGKYYAVIDEGLSEAEMLAKALAENMSEKGERKDLSVLEEIGIFRRAAKLLSGANASLVLKMLNRDEDYFKRRVSLAENFSEERLRKLYEIEGTSDFRFKIGHLERLQRNPDERQFVMMAAIIADARLKPSQVDVAEDLPEQAVNIPWFAKLFPGYGMKRDSAQAGSADSELPSSEQIEALAEMLEGKGPPQSSTVRELGQPAPMTASSAEPPSMPVYEQDVLFVKCPFCSSENPCKLREKAEVTFIYPQQDGIVQKATVEPDAIYRVRHECHGCGKQFFVLISPVEGTTSAESLKTNNLREPEPKTAVGSLDWDSGKLCWIKTVDDKPSILVLTAGRKIGTG